MNKFIALEIFRSLTEQTKDEQKEFLTQTTKFFNCSLRELYDRLKYFGHELQGGQNE